MHQIFTFTLLVNIKFVAGIIGFDCSGKYLNVTTLSLLDIGKCDPKPTSVNSTTMDIQLLQISEYANVEIMQCKVEISRTIYRCGMFSHVSVVQNGRADYIYDVSRPKCQQLHYDGSISFGNGVYLTGLRINATATRSVTLAGSLANDGSCEGTQYSDTYGTWDKVVVQASVKITLKQSNVPVKLNSDEIILKSSTRCQYSLGRCMDIADGSTYWTPAQISKCSFENYDVLYDGKATKITTSEPNNPVIYTLTSQETTFALTQVEEINICGYNMIRTEHPRLYIVEGTLRIPTHPIQVENLDLFTYVNSKFVYVERHIRMQITALYDDILLHRCLLERRVLQNAITMATLAPDEFAYNLMKTPGYMAVAAGEVVHIVKCQPVEVYIRKTEHCYNEMPVTHGNHSMFLTPKSRILLRVGTIRGCNSALSTMFRLNKQWHKFIPMPVDTVSPREMEPQNVPTWRYNAPGPLATSGIYSAKDLDNLRDHIMFSKEQPAILNTIVREAAGRASNNDDIHMYDFLDEQTLHKIAESTISKFWQGLLTFGSATAALLGIYVILRTALLLINTLLNGYAIHTMYGSSIYIIAAFFHSLTNILIMRGRPQGERGSPTPLTNTYIRAPSVDTVTVSTQSEPNPPSNTILETTGIPHSTPGPSRAPTERSTFQRELEERVNRLQKLALKKTPAKTIGCEETSLSLQP